MRCVKNRARRSGIILAVVGVLMLAGCDDDDGKRGNASTPTPTTTASRSPTVTLSPTTSPTNTPVATATATLAPSNSPTHTNTQVPTVTPTPTEGHHGPPHSIMRVGSTESGSGALTVDGVPIAFVAESACVGGTDEHCDEGMIVYTGTSPGFDDLTADDPNKPIYVLPEGIEVSIEITAIEADVSVLISGVVLDEVGETASVNTTGHLHNHPTWTLVAPAGAAVSDRQITFRLHAAGFQSSDTIPLTLRVFADGEGGHDHDE